MRQQQSKRPVFETTSRPRFSRQGDTGTFSSCVCGNKTRYFNAKYYIFLTLTDWLLCLNVTGPKHYYSNNYSSNWVGAGV